MENVTPPQPSPAAPAGPSHVVVGVAIPSAGVAWLVAGLVLGLVGHTTHLALIRFLNHGYGEWALTLVQYLIYAGGLVGAVGAVAIGVRIALPNAR